MVKQKKIEDMWNICRGCYSVWLFYNNRMKKLNGKWIASTFIFLKNELKVSDIGSYFSTLMVTTKNE